MEGKIFYVTRGKLEELKKEHTELIAFERQKTVGVEAPKILESEDLNTEFVSYHEDMDALRLKIDELHNVINNHELIKMPPKEQRALVGIGARVTLGNNGKHDEFTIVGTLEADPVSGRISNESPVGKALIGCKVGDEISIDTPEKAKYKIKNIQYEIS